MWGEAKESPLASEDGVGAGCREIFWLLRHGQLGRRGEERSRARSKLAPLTFSSKGILIWGRQALGRNNVFWFELWIQRAMISHYSYIFAELCDSLAMVILGQLHNLPTQIQIRQFRARILLPGVDNPPHRCQKDYANEDHAVVIHRRHRRRIYIRYPHMSASLAHGHNRGEGLTEAEHDVEEYDE